MARLRDVIGQKSATSGLLSALRADRVSGAYLFAGPAQTGRTTAAIGLAAALHCEAPDGHDACGACASCRRVRDGRHPDVLYVQPETSAMKIDQVREVKRWTAVSPFYGGKKVVILRDAERLTAEAGNSLLKLLEESDAAYVFVLIAEHAYSVLPTLVSRCRVIPFHRAARAELERALVDRGEAPEVVERLAALADGRPGRVLQGKDAVTELEAARDAVVDWVSELASGPTGRRLVAMDAWGKDRNEVEARIRLLQSWFRDLAVWRSTGEPSLLTHSDRHDDIRTQAANYDSTAFLAALDHLGAALRMLRSHVNVRLVLDYVAVSCTRALNRTD